MPDCSIHEEKTFQRSPITQALIDLLKATPEGELCTFEDMVVAARKNIRDYRSRHYLTKALEICSKEYGCEFVSVRNKGYLRRTNAEIVGGAVVKARIRINRISDRLDRGLNNVDVAQLNPSQKMGYIGARLYATVVNAAGSKKMLTECDKLAQKNPEKQIDKSNFFKVFGKMG